MVIWILKIHTYSECPRRIVEKGIGKRYYTPNGLSRERFQCHVQLLAESHPGHINLVDIEVEPNRIKVGDSVEWVSFLDVLPATNTFLNDRAVERCVDRNVCSFLFCPFNLCDLLWLQSPQTQLLSRGRKI